MSAVLAVSPSTAQERRRIVEVALSALLDRTQLAMALLVWDQRFANEVNFPYATFSSTVSRKVPGAPRAGTLLQALALGVHPSSGTSTGTNIEMPSLPPGAEQAMRAAPVEPAQDAQVICELAVFNALLSAILSRLDAEVLTDLREHWQATVTSCGLSAEGVAEIRPWCASIDHELHAIDSPLSLDDMRTVMHHFYVWLCEDAGPVATDKLFNTAMRVVERMPQARRFSPRKLL